MQARQAAREIVRCCRSLWEAGLIAGADGRGLLKSELGPADLVEVDLAGKRQNGYRDATTELDLHLRVYRQQKQCGAVVHAHPPTATAFAVAGEGLPVLANHGALTWGQDLTQARIRMESLEHAARILLAARALGRVSRLTREQIDALERMRGPSFHGQNDLGY